MLSHFSFIIYILQKSLKSSARTTTGKTKEEETTTQAYKESKHDLKLAFVLFLIGWSA
jgi:hypothetical protein